MSDKDYSNPIFRDKLDMGQIIFRQVDRVNLAASQTYESGVLQKLNTLPMNWRLWVEKQDERFIISKETFEFEAPCGSPIGTITDPCLKNPDKPALRYPGPIDLDDPNIKEIKNNGTEEDPDIELIAHNPSIPFRRFIGEINWDDPNILSPKMTIEDYVDYQKMDAVIMEAHEFAGLTYQTELKLVDGGDTLEQIEKRRKTPFRMFRPKEEKKIVEEEEGDN